MLHTLCRNCSMMILIFDSDPVECYPNDTDVMQDAWWFSRSAREHPLLPRVRRVPAEKNLTAAPSL